MILKKERAHSKFSASGAERWFKCPGSVELSEGLPDKTSIYAEEGTRAHEVLEDILEAMLKGRTTYMITDTEEMARRACDAARFMVGIYKSLPESMIQVETRIYLDFIHPEMFGTFDGAVIDYFGTLHVFDYKYGAGYAVSAKENLQMIFYAIGVAHLHHWNFKKVRMWIIQPRISGYDGPTFWEIGIFELKAYVGKFTEAVSRVEKRPDLYIEGQHCHWCKAKSICPMKTEKKLNKARQAFTMTTVRSTE